jgi:hypothetical protein
MGQVQQAHDILALLQERVTHPALRLSIEAPGAAMAVHENRFDTGLVAAEAMLNNPDSPRQAVDFAAFAAGLALPVAGRGSEYEPIAARCRAEQKPTDGMIRVMVRYCDVLALTHTGQLDEADRRVADYPILFGGTVSRLGDRQDHGRPGRHLPRQIPRGHLLHRAGPGRAQRRNLTALAASGAATAGPRLRCAGQDWPGRTGTR